MSCLCVRVSVDDRESTSAKASSVISNASTASSSYSGRVSAGDYREAESLRRPDSVRRTAIYGKAHAIYSFHADRNNSRYAQVCGDDAVSYQNTLYTCLYFAGCVIKQVPSVF